MRRSGVEWKANPDNGVGLECDEVMTKCDEVCGVNVAIASAGKCNSEALIERQCPDALAVDSTQSGHAALLCERPELQSRVRTARENLHGAYVCCISQFTLPYLKLQ